MPHQLAKAPGGDILITLPWRNGTVDSAGVPTRWPFLLRAWLGNNAQGPWLSARGQGLDGISERRVTRFAMGADPGAQSSSALFTAPPAPGTVWDVKVVLEAAPSDDRGFPIADTWVLVDEQLHAAAVVVV